MIFDSDITIWMLRGHSRALQVAATVVPRARIISAMSHLELMYGCRDRKEMTDLQHFLADWFAEIAPLTPAITDTARALMQDFALSHRPDPGDLLIAATAIDRKDGLVTGNAKHFQFIPGLELKIFRP